MFALEDVLALTIRARVAFVIVCASRTIETLSPMPEIHVCGKNVLQNWVVPLLTVERESEEKVLTEKETSNGRDEDALGRVLLPERKVSRLWARRKGKYTQNW